MLDESIVSALSAAAAPLRRASAALCLLLAAAAAAGYTALWRNLAPAAPAPAPVRPPAFPSLAGMTAFDWSALRAAPGRPAAPGGGGAAARFRLAGTFVVLGEEQGELRKAIIDDLEQGGQLLVGEGERIGPVLVARVWADRVTLNADGELIELRLAYTGGAAAGAGPAAGADPEAGRAEPPLEVSRFGERIAEGRWNLSKTALTEYYQELLDHPERIGKLYETFEPIYTEDRRIGGYRIAVKGEEEFLRATGLKEGDVVRSVNSLAMSSQSRAEFFIREFMQNRLETVVVDVERSGRPEKLIYFMK